MNNDDKDLNNLLKCLDDDMVEEIAENYPALDEDTVKRILDKCIGKSEDDKKQSEELTVTGTERYNRPLWYKYASAVAVVAVAVVGITSVFMLHRSMSSTDDFDIKNSPMLTDSSAENKKDDSRVTFAVTTETSGKVFEGYTAGTVTVLSVGEEIIPTTTAESNESNTSLKTQPQSAEQTTTQSPETDLPDTETAVTDIQDIDYEISQQYTQEEETISNVAVDTAVSTSAIVGKWYSETESGVSVYEFYDDSTGITYIDGTSEVSRFEYTISDSLYVSFTLVSGNEKIVKEGEFIDGCESSQIIIKWNDGTTQTFFPESVWVETFQ